MGRFTPIKTTIDAEIRQNGQREITGQIMNGVMNGMMDSTDAALTDMEAAIRGDMVSAESLSEGLSTKVDKVSGKGLSSNDYTTTEKQKLAGLKNYDDTGVKASIANVETAVKGKQDIISDLESIRSGAEKGATALQGVPSEYITETELAGKGYATTSALTSGLSGKVDKVSGKQLSTEDFTTALKNKLQGLSNYDDASVNAAIAGLQQQLNTLTSGNASAAIESFNEIIAFLDGVKDTQDLAGIIASIEQQIAAKANASDIPTKVSQLTNDKGYLTSHQDISGLATKTEVSSGLAGKQDVISDLATIRSGAAKGATALQSIPSEYVTETELGAKGYAIASDVTTSLNGKVDKVSGKGLSTNDFTTTEKEKLAGIAAGAEVNVQSDWSATSGDAFIKNKPSLAAVATSGSYNDLSNKPTIPAAVTESTISGWGFTKNTGTYSKPSTGIPATDLASSVQTSLGKADTALQSYTEKYTGTYSKPSTGIPKSDLDSSVQTSLGKADTALQSYTETDPVFKASTAAFAITLKSYAYDKWSVDADVVVALEAHTNVSLTRKS